MNPRRDAFLSGVGITCGVVLLLDGGPLWLMAMNFIGGIGCGITAFGSGED